jgi:N-sulfoglucosamine sulfohydrolase
MLCLAIAIACPLLLLQAGEAGADPERPNILVLMAEDMGPRVGAFGDPVAATPHIDRLATEGVRYPDTFTNLKLDYQFSEVGPGSGPFTIWDHEGRLRADWRERESGQPFFGLVNLPSTHESALFPRTGFPKSATHLFFQLIYAITFWGHEDVVAPGVVRVPPYYPDTPTVRSAIARHYNNIHKMDEEVGAILEALERDGLADSTIVIWTTDHGDGLPRAKRELFDSGIRVPMIVRWPDALRPATLPVGSVDPRLVSFVDLAPTVLTMARLPVPDYMVGHDFTTDDPADRREYVYAAKDRMDEIPDRQRAIRDRRFKYIRNYHPEEPGARRLYREPFELSGGETLSVKTVRYGWRESDEVQVDLRASGAE